MQYVAAIDQGTTGTRCLLVSHGGAVVGQAYETHEQIYPEPGWVEHDPTVLWENTKTVVTDALAAAGGNGEVPDGVELDVGYVGSPEYRTHVRAPDYTTAEPPLESAAERARQPIAAAGGAGEFHTERGQDDQ